MELESINKTIEYIAEHPNHEKRIGISGGKDSDLTLIILKKVFQQITDNKYTVDVYNTTNDTAATYLHIKQDLKIGIQDIHSPKKGLYRWLKEDTHYFIPTKLVRKCCSTYKEGRMKEILDKEKNYLIFVGMRKYESTKRAFYDWDLNEAYKKKGLKLNAPDNWKRFLPIVNWRDEDVWLYLLHNNVKFNKMYRYGFNRTGCLLCPFSSDYTDLLIKKYYPQQWARWEEILKKNYELWGVKARLKFTMQEWLNGAWKPGTSKEYEIINQKPTEARIKELVDLKGISEELAIKYFQKKCNCGKKLNPDEVAMSLKIKGKEIGFAHVSNDDMLCKKCFCKQYGITTKEYSEKVMQYRNEGCSLF